MKISALLEGRKRLVEGGNLSINGHEAQHLDLKVTKRSYMVPKLNELLYAINSAYYKMYKESLWSNEVLASGKFLSGSSLHFFNVKGISDEVFTEKKPTVGDIDTMVDKTKEPNLQQFLTAYTNKQIGSAVFLGFQRGNEQFSGLFELQDPPVKVQIDFEFVEFEKDNPTDWARFSHSSSWEDLQAGVKGVFHKWLIQAFTALTRKNFILRKMKGRGKLRQEVDEPAADNMYSFAVSSKEGGGLRAKYEPVLDDNGNPLVIKGLPVMREAPTSGYNQDIGQIFSTILDQRLKPNQAKKLEKQFWSFTGLLQVMNTLLTTEEKEQVMQGFLLKTIGPGAQGMYKNNPDKDIAEKTVAINTLLNTLKLPKPSNLDQMLDTYRKSYSMTPADGGEKPSTDVVKAMAKNTLAEAVPSYKRKGIQHIYNPGSSTEMKDEDFINFCKEIAHDGGNFASVPINLKVDGAGIRFGRTQNGEPFFMTSRVETPMTKANIGDFEKYGRSQGQSDEQLARTQNYDKALSTIVNAEFMKDIPPDTIVQAEMLFNPMAQQDNGGYKFVNIPYDPKKLGKVMTLVPISVKQYSTGEQSPDAAEIKEALIKDSTPNIKMVNNTLSHKGIDVSKIVNPIVKNAEALSKAISQRGDSPDKQKAKAILSTARQALSKSIINSPIPGKDQLGDMIEGLVINMPSGTLAKVTSTDMQQKMADKQAMNKKPTETSNRTKPAVVTIGSFVGHKGHEQLINQTIETADRVGGDPYIYVSPVVGPDDPIPPADKVKTLQKLYPQYAKNIQVWDSQGTPVKKIEKELVLPANSPYNKIILLVGDDRYEGFKNWMDSLEKRMKDPAAIAKYGGTQNQVDFETIRTERDPSKGGTGISFTQLRDKLKDPNASEQDKLNFWMQAFDTKKLGADWVKHLMDTTAKNMGIQQQAIKEYIQKIKPMLEYATPTQKVKIYNQLAEAKQKLSEMGEPSSNNLANVVAKLINSKKPEIFSRYGDKKVMDTIIDTCTNNVGKTEMELAVEAMIKLKHFVKEDYDRSMLRDGFSTEQEINGILYKAVGKSFKGSYGGTLTITAYDKNKKIGMAQFTDHFEKSGLESLSTDVDPAYQRQGIASTMYAYARMLGNTIHPSIVQTKQGEKMWKGWKKSGDAKFLKKESVAERMKMELAVEAMTKLKHLAESELDRFKKYTRPVVKTEPKIERTTNPAGRTTDHVEWIVTSDTGERRRFTSKKAAQEYYILCTKQGVAEAGITGSSRSADAIAKQKEWQSSSASDSKQDTKTFSYQGYTINFTPDTLNIYLGGDLVLSRKGNFAQPTKKQLVAARLSIGKIIDDKRREALIHSVIQKNKGRQGVAENNTAAGINKMFSNLGDPVFSNLQRVALLAMQGRQQEAYGRLQSVIKDASPQVQKKIIDAVNNIKPVTINGKIADSSTIDKSKQHQDWIINTFIPWVQSLLGKQSVAEGLNEGVGGNYLYHATGADGLKGMLSSGSIRSATGPQTATKAQTTLPTVSITRDWNYASGGAGASNTSVGHDAILVLDRNAVENNFKTLGTSQSQDVRGQAYTKKQQVGRYNMMSKFKTDDPERQKEIDTAYRAPKAGGEFEEVVVVPKGSLPLKETMVGFWVNPQSQLTKDPEVMNDPRRLELAPGGTGRFVKAQQPQGVAEKMKMGATIEPMEDKEQSDPVVDATIKFYKPVMQKASEQEVEHYVEKAKHLLQTTDDPAVRKKLIDIFKEGKDNPYLQGGIITAIAALLGGGAINLANNIQLTPYQTNLMMQGILNTIVPAVGARMNGKNWVDTLKYTLASLGVGVGIASVMEKEDDVMSHVAKELTGPGAPIAKLRAARDLEQMRKRERSDGLPVEPKFDYLDEK